MSASQQLAQINGGLLDTELNAAIAECVNKSMEHGKKATLTLKLEFVPQNLAQGTVRVSHDIKTLLPKEKREGGIMYALPSGSLTPDNPAQGKLDLKDVADTKPNLKKIG